MMARRLLSVALLCYLGLAAWLLTSWFSVWGDDLTATVAQVVRSWTVTPTRSPSAGGIDFIECFGCDSLPGVQGYAAGFLLLLLGGGPLAILGLVLDRRPAHGHTPAAGLWQGAFVVQIASVAVGVLVLGLLLQIASDARDVLHWVTACAFADVVAGVPALAAWRRLLARAGDDARPVLRDARA